VGSLKNPGAAVKKAKREDGPPVECLFLTSPFMEPAPSMVFYQEYPTNPRVTDARFPDREPASRQGTIGRSVVLVGGFKLEVAESKIPNSIWLRRWITSQIGLRHALSNGMKALKLAPCLTTLANDYQPGQAKSDKEAAQRFTAASK
jgi:hypothetical protein